MPRIQRKCSRRWATKSRNPSKHKDRPRRAPTVLWPMARTYCRARRSSGGLGNAENPSLYLEAMEQVDAAYLQEMFANTPTTKEDKKSDFAELDESVSWESIQTMAQKMGRNKDYDMDVIITLLTFLLKLWNDQIANYSKHEKMSTKVKMTRVIYTQTKEYVKPLFRKLKHHTLPEDILDSLRDICKHLLNRNYITASDAYLEMAIGNAPWPIGVTMVGIHARTGREKIFSKNVAHVMNDETQRKYIQGLKRLMTKCQEYFPTDPSKCVEYVSKKDRE
ncbi:uncharacterized protein Dyak_GE25155, isoform B [Drosophila yakuba]|uniref:Pre-mRNA-splicing factor 18 n=2 Tax=Drosophila yakuba TaxID=7245 RepID=A0A0R1E596_DROYA|nr:uncharacterized protein Dyak_GE25155, isoform B [Drosophila yakuba]